VKVFQDLTEIEALRQQVRRKDRLAALGEMAATVAHEIRNPLGGIRGFAALLGRDLRGNESASRLVDKILRGTANLERVVNELLEYTRPVDLRRRPTPCRELVEAAAGYIDPVPENVEFVNEVDEDLRMLVDPDKMRQVLLNILLNAAQSIDGAGCVSIRSESGGGTVSLFVTDTGRGMDEDELGRIFTPFYTTKEKGTGLGLAIALKIVESHGGALVAESQPGRGSTFALRLPAAP